MKYIFLSIVLFSISCNYSNDIADVENSKNEKTIDNESQQKDTITPEEYRLIMDSLRLNAGCELLKNDSLQNIKIFDKTLLIDCAPALDSILNNFNHYVLFSHSFTGTQKNIIPYFSFRAKRNDTTYSFFVAKTNSYNFDYIYYKPINKYLKSSSNIILLREIYPLMTSKNCLTIIDVEYEPVDVAKWEEKHKLPFWPSKDGKVINVDTIKVCN